MRTIQTYKRRAVRSGLSYSATTRTSEEEAGRTNGNDIITIFKKNEEDVPNMYEFTNTA